MSWLVRSTVRGVVACAIGALALGVGSSQLAAKKKPAPDRGSVVFGKRKGLWLLKVGEKKPKEIASLGFKASRLVRIQASAAGTIFLVSTSENHYWVEPNGKTGKAMSVVRHVCRGKASLSQDGDMVLCEDADGALSVQTISTQKTVDLTARGRMSTLGSDGEVVIAGANGIEGVSIADPKKKRTLGVLDPASGLSVAPNGKNAAAVFTEDDGSTGLYSFVLDGKGVRRKLVTEAIPVAWSSDSKWLVVTRKKRGCVVRAAGGQYRCFDGYRALGVSPDHKDALLVSGKKNKLSVFRADLGGARSSKPKPIVTGAQGAAIWIR